MRRPFVLFFSALTLLCVGCEPRAEGNYAPPVWQSESLLPTSVKDTVFVQGEPEFEALCPARVDLTFRTEHRVQSLRDNIARTERLVGAQNSPQLSHAKACLAEFERLWAADPARRERQAQLVATLAREYQCNIRVYSQAEQMTLKREVSVPDCDWLKHVSLAPQATHGLRQLAATLRPQEAVDFEQQAQDLEEWSAKAEPLRALAQQMRVGGVIAQGPSGIEFSRLGHPFESEDRSKLLLEYVSLARVLNDSLPMDRRNAEGCPKFACDEVIFRVGQLLEAESTQGKARPDDIRWGQPVTPNPFVFDQFSSRLYLDQGTLRLVGLDTAAYPYLLKGSQIAPRLSGSDLVFDRGLAGLRVTITQWSSRDPYPRVLPLYWALVEGDRLRRLALQLNPNLIVQEIRFEAYEPGQPWIVVENEGQTAVIRARALRSDSGLTLAKVRAELEAALRQTFSRALISDLK